MQYWDYYELLGPNWEAGQDFRPPPNWDASFEYRGGGDQVRGGDLYVELQIVLPKADTDQARQASNELRQRLDFDPRALF